MKDIILAIYESTSLSENDKDYLLTILEDAKTDQYRKDMHKASLVNTVGGQAALIGVSGTIGSTAEAIKTLGKLQIIMKRIAIKKKQLAKETDAVRAEKLKAEISDLAKLQAIENQKCGKLMKSAVAMTGVTAAGIGARKYSKHMKTKAAEKRDGIVYDAKDSEWRYV